jgi:hypothetical protein
MHGKGVYTWADGVRYEVSFIVQQILRCHCHYVVNVAEGKSSGLYATLAFSGRVCKERYNRLRHI